MGHPKILLMLPCGGFLFAAGGHGQALATAPHPPTPASPMHLSYTDSDLPRDRPGVAGLKDASLAWLAWGPCRLGWVAVQSGGERWVCRPPPKAFASIHTPNTLAP